MHDCIFCKIINKELDASILWEDEKVIVFLDIFPKNPGHTLVIPKKHENHLLDLDDETYSYLFKIAKKIGKSLQKTLSSERIGIIVEGFAVPHAHIHLIPINHPSDLDNKSQKADSEELNVIYQKVLKEIE